MVRRAVMAAATILVLASSSVTEAQTVAAAAPQYLTYTEDVPCPPADKANHVRRVVRKHRAHRRHLRRHAVVTPRRLPAKPRHVRIVHRPRARSTPLIRIADPLKAKRCTVVRRQPLTTASFGVVPETAALTPVLDEAQPGGSAASPATSGRAPFADQANPSAGGGDPVVGTGGTVSPAPEPRTWWLMISGVAFLGLALRRRRGSADDRERLVG